MNRQNHRPGNGSYRPVYSWLLTTGLVIFGIVLLWRYGLIHQIVDADLTYLSLVILVIFFLVSGYLGFSSLRLARISWQLEMMKTTSDNVPGNGRDYRVIEQYLDMLCSVPENDGRYGEGLHGWLVERLHRGHSLGWFAADGLIRMGLIGTVIGFIIMLGSVYSREGNDVSLLKDLLGSMGAGMQVALYTTLSGISTSLVLTIYCRNLDRYADDLVGEIIRFSIDYSQDNRHG